MFNEVVEMPTASNYKSRNRKRLQDNSREGTETLINLDNVIFGETQGKNEVYS